MAKLKETKGDVYVFEMNVSNTTEVEYTSSELDEKIARYTDLKTKMETDLADLDAKLAEYQALKDLIV